MAELEQENALKLYIVTHVEFRKVESSGPCYKSPTKKIPTRVFPDRDFFSTLSLYIIHGQIKTGSHKCKPPKQNIHASSKDDLTKIIVHSNNFFNNSVSKVVDFFSDTYSYLRLNRTPNTTIPTRTPTNKKISTTVPNTFVPDVMCMRIFLSSDSTFRLSANDSVLIVAS